MSLFELAGMGWISRSLGVAARLGIADQLAGGPQRPEQLAALTDTHAEALRHLLRALGMVGVFRENEDGAFELTEAAEPLRSDHPESLRHWCMLCGEMYYDVWRDLLSTVQTGQPASAAHRGGSLYAYMEHSREAAEIYDKAMADLTRPAAAELARELDLAGVRRIVDVGGGGGELLSTILRAHPGLLGVVADRADVTARGRAQLHATGDDDLIERLSFVATDFFDAVPAGGDVYVLKNVLHNWSADSSVRILASVRAAMVQTIESESEPAAADPPILLVVEPLLGHDSVSSIRALFQMVVCEEGTRTRSEQDMREQAERAGFAIRSIRLLSTEHSVAELALGDAPPAPAPAPPADYPVATVSSASRGGRR